MGALIDGKWSTEEEVATSNEKGEFVRKDTQFHQFISKEAGSKFPANKNRYHFYFSYACPWAHRALIFIKLKELDGVVSYSFVSPYMLENGWEFSEPDTLDPLYQSKYLYQIYQKADKDYSGKVTVPVLWDKKTETIVNNESSEIIRMLNSEFNEFTSVKQNYYPDALKDKIDDINEFVYENINNGVYKTGFAKTQQAYNEAVDNLFAALDKIENILMKNRYLVGKDITEADWRLFTTLIRFDQVYYTHFKCNIRRIIDYPNIFNYMLELYQMPNIAETVNFDHIKKHYFTSHEFLNPSRIVPKGPLMDYWQKHNRS